MQDLRDICSSQGWDLSKPNLSREDSSAAWDACKKLLKNQFLREVFRLFGNRFRTMAIAAQEQKPVGRGFSAIERTIGEEIDAVPSDELSGFAHPALRILALQDVAEGTLIQDAYREIYQRQEGDIIALMDDSGSTAGKIAHFIKGAVLGLQAIAQSQGRRMVVIPFTSVAHAKIDLTEGKPQDLLRLAELRADGGTDFEVALRAGIAAVKDGFNPDQAPDIVMFTDGACPIPCYAYNTALEKVAEVKARVMAELKRELEALGARLKVVYVGVRKPTPYPDIGELAGPGNEIFLESILEAEKLTKVYEQI